MWKERLKGFIFGGVVVGILTSTVFAAPVEKAVKIFYNNIKVFVDNNMVDCKDASGNKIEPFIYNGTTYLPIRSVGEAFGKQVKWDGKTNSIFIGNTDPNTPSTWLDEMKYMSFVCFKPDDGKIGAQIDWQRGLFFDFNTWNPDSDHSNTNETFNHGIKVSLGIPRNGYTIGTYACKQSKLEYYMNQKYKKIKGKIVLHQDSASTAKKAIIKIYKDGELAYTTPVIGAGSLPADFDIDITGTIKLTITIDAQGNYDDDAFTNGETFGLVNVGLYQ